jgi:septal ring factor EnvC (AmiA/AmiB activator)
MGENIEKKKDCVATKIPKLHFCLRLTLLLFMLMCLITVLYQASFLGKWIEGEGKLNGKDFKLNVMEEKLNNKEEKLNNKEFKLNEKEVNLDEKERNLNEKERNLNEKERNLNEKVRNLNEKERNLNENDLKLNETQNQNPQSGPSMQYEMTRRKTRRDLNEFWFFVRAKLEHGLQDASNRSNQEMKLLFETAFTNAHHRYNNVVKDLDLLAENDGHADWRNKEVSDC